MQQQQAQSQQMIQQGQRHAQQEMAQLRQQLAGAAQQMGEQARQLTDLQAQLREALLDNQRLRAELSARAGGGAPAGRTAGGDRHKPYPKGGTDATPPPPPQPTAAAAGTLVGPSGAAGTVAGAVPPGTEAATEAAVEAPPPQPLHCGLCKGDMSNGEIRCPRCPSWDQAGVPPSD